MFVYIDLICSLLHIHAVCFFVVAASHPFFVGITCSVTHFHSIYKQVCAAEMVEIAAR